MAQQMSGATLSFACCGVRIDSMRVHDAAERLAQRHSGGRSVHLCNAYTLSLARRDPQYAQMLNRADLNLPDGAPLVWVSRRLGFSIRDSERPRGTDVFLSTVIAGQELGLRHYLYGSTPEVIEALASRLMTEAPTVRIVGIEAPPFRALSEQEEHELVARVRSSEADIVWVGLGTPKQDQFVDEFRDRLGVTLVAVGAAFDFLAGTKREAPMWTQTHGLEWAYRLVSEPQRLWKRYLVGNASFLAGLARDGVSVAPAR
jgi:N-acetylglucosaminyldiphosphoundecaprenol N-acetyl-beta-D-mannosaminyltransferase